MNEATTTSGVASCVAEAHADVCGQAYLSQERCVNWLLDCLNAAVRPSVRRIVQERLSDICRVGLVAGAEFRSALDQIAMAFEVDQAFDHLEVQAS